MFRVFTASEYSSSFSRCSDLRFSFACAAVRLCTFFDSAAELRSAVDRRDFALAWLFWTCDNFVLSFAFSPSSWARRSAACSDFWCSSCRSA